VYGYDWINNSKSPMARAGGGCGDEQDSLNSKNGCPAEHPAWLPSMEHTGLHPT
jgi:hypothetical protein